MRSKSPELMGAIKEFVNKYYREHHTAPSTQTIGAAVGVTRNTVYRYLVEMNERGMLQYDKAIKSIEQMTKCKTGYFSAPVVGSIRCGDPESEEARAMAREMSPLFIVKDGVSYPPFMILHGDADRVVPYETQGECMADRLDEAGADVTLVRIEGADHEGDFWSDELHDIVLEFIDRHMR